MKLLHMQLKHNKHLLVALLMGGGIAWALPATGGLTPLGVRLLAIVVPTIYLWLFVNTHWVSVLFLALLPLTGIMPANQVWASAFGHFAVMLVLSFSLISECLNQQRVIERLAHWFVTRRFVQGRPYGFMAMYFGANLVIGIFMQNLALAVIFVNLTAQICQQLGLGKDHRLYQCLMLGTFWGNGVLSIASPIAKTLPNVLIGLVYANTGRQITYAQWLMVGLPFMAVSFGVLMLAIRMINPPTEALSQLQLAEPKTLSAKGKVAMSAMGVLVVIILVPELLLLTGVWTGLASFVLNQGVIVPALLTVIALNVIHVQEAGRWEPVMDFEHTARQTPMTLLVFVAAVVVMGVPLAADATGVVVWMQGLLLPLSLGLTPWLLFAVLIVLAVVATNFLSSTVVITLFMSLGTALFLDSGINPLVFAVVMAFAASMATLTPSSTVTAPLYYGPGHLNVRQVLKSNLLFLGLITPVLLAFIPWVRVIMGR